MGLFGGGNKEAQPTLNWEALEAGGPRFGSGLPKLGRTKVPGGWLVMHCSVDAAGLTFVPDPEHAWDGNSLP